MLEPSQPLQPYASCREWPTHQLLSALTRFPSSVLPIGILRELQSRGTAIHDELVARIWQEMDATAKGLGSGTNIGFFAFALLTPIANYQDSSLLECLFKKLEENADKVIGDLRTEAMPQLISSFFKDQDASEVIAWIDRVAAIPDLDALNASLLFRAMTIAVAKGFLERDMAIDVLVNRLESRSQEKQDLLSAFIVIELLDLSAQKSKAVDTVVRASFKRNQIDTEMVELQSWDSIDEHNPLERLATAWSDPALELSHWCYDFVSDSFDPVNASYRVNCEARRWTQLEEASTIELIDQLQKSNDDHFPKHAFAELNDAFTDAYQATIDLIRAEVERYQRESQSEPDSFSWSGNGAYLGIVLLVTQRMPLPTDLLETILGLPTEDREKIFGDQFHLIVTLAAFTPLNQTDFIEQFIWDNDRCTPDRREMVNFYSIACADNQLDRQIAIDKLAEGLRRALSEMPELIGPYTENLAILSPGEQIDLIETAFQRDDVDWFQPISDLRRFCKDIEFAKEQYRKQYFQLLSADEIIEESAMFASSTWKEQPTRLAPLMPAYRAEPVHEPVTTVRNEGRTPRNAPCPCGSGKKYKQCCIHAQ